MAVQTVYLNWIATEFNMEHRQTTVRAQRRHIRIHMGKFKHILFQQHGLWLERLRTRIRCEHVETKKNTSRNSLICTPAKLHTTRSTVRTCLGSSQRCKCSRHKPVRRSCRQKPTNTSGYCSITTPPRAVIDRPPLLNANNQPAKMVWIATFIYEVGIEIETMSSSPQMVGCNNNMDIHDVRASASYSRRRVSLYEKLHM